RVLDLDPIGAPAGPVGPIAAFCDDALGTECAGVAENRLPVAVKVLGKPDTKKAGPLIAPTPPPMQEATTHPGHAGDSGGPPHGGRRPGHRPTTRLPASQSSGPQQGRVNMSQYGLQTTSQP